ncbi:MAG: hypothetical protein HY962_09690 [Ignavibacteriae bacterium]|nr:hypothetical protein [Ignavibacteriota bacterium]
MRSSHSFKHHRGKVLTGVLIMAAGVLLLLSNFRLLDIGSVWSYWPLIIVAVGLDKLVTAANSKQRGEGVWLTFVGGWLLVSVQHIFGLTFGTSWPILLVGFGIGMVWRAVEKARESQRIEAEYGNGN